ncbi:MAG: undecaprenyl/decaprenyl-phosphate alpha-N-acetylglucosaminyl 1-phosphate transferase [Nitrosomonas sp.]|nr:undecaprenyl/decaprenyl-phosphate alpha-N-acetylglucosaminyl 1-phosphate transferase [Nitrosomonas sp.]
MINILLLFVFCTFLSAVTIHIAIKLANFYRIADHPGEHKHHNESTPFVGGVGVFATLCVAFVVLFNFFPDHKQQWLVLGICSLIIFITGFLDDILQLAYKLRLTIQMIVAFIMVLAGGIVLEDLGGIFLGLPLQLGLFAIPFTVFAVIGGINIINMIDGIDGLSGSLSLVSFFFLAIVAYVGGDLANLFLIAALIGGVAGFLNYNLRYNLRYYSRSSARVFLGDNGSMLIGFLFAWLLVDLAQGISPAMRPVAAIWLLSIPLMDAISVMHRRIRMGSSPFKPDNNHLHHILLRAGYRNEEVVFAIVSLHFMIGLIGLTGLYLGVQDFFMFLGFLLVYAGYFYLTLRPWHYIPALCFLHTRLRLTPIANCGIFSGKFTVIGAENMAMKISKEVRSRMDFWVQIFKQSSDGKQQRYALALNIRLPKDQHDLDGRMNRYVSLLQQRLKKKYDIQLRQLAARAGDKGMSTYNDDDNFGRLHLLDRRAVPRRCPGRRASYQRSLDSQVLVFEVTFFK